MNSTISFGWTVSCLGAVFAPHVATQEKMEWVPVHELTVEGQAWKDVASPFDRLPKKAKAAVRKAVWDLSRDAAGICVRFRTDAPMLYLRWDLTRKRLGMSHMPPSGVSGVDLYYLDGETWRWAKNARPSGVSNRVALWKGWKGTSRDFMLYLPLYNGVTKVELGFSGGAKVLPLPRENARKPIVFYGTSITQGACASRPGMVHTAILGRRLDVPVVNLGFSGNGKLEKELGALIQEIDASVYVLDCLPNLNAKLVTERTVPFVLALRKARPNTPIVMVADRLYADSVFRPGRRMHNERNWKAFRRAYEELQGRGLKKLYYIPGATLLGEDGEDTVDGSHPTDLGFMRQADAMEKVLRRALADG